MPIGICVATRAMKNAALARPRASGDSARSWISSGPSTLVEARKNWLATVAATTATRTLRPPCEAWRRGVSWRCAGAGDDFSATSHRPPDTAGEPAAEIVVWCAAATANTWSVRPPTVRIHSKELTYRVHDVGHTVS